MTPDVAGFLTRFHAFGAAPGRESYLALFHPDATLFDAGMERPIGVAEIPEHIEAILRLVPDFRMRPERWRERHGTVFVEARNCASLGGRRSEWRSVYCVDLVGDQVRRGRRYYDRRPLFARLDPTLPQLPAPRADAAEDTAEAAPAVDAAGIAAAWTAGFADASAAALVLRADGVLDVSGCPHPFTRPQLASVWAAFGAWLPGAKQQAVQWAGDDDLVFVEWQLEATLAGSPLVLGGCDRLDLAGGLALHVRRYFDTLGLATRLAGREA